MSILVTGAGGFHRVVTARALLARRAGRRDRQSQRLLRSSAEAGAARRGSLSDFGDRFRFERIDFSDAGALAAGAAVRLRSDRSPRGAGGRSLQSRKSRAPTSSRTSSGHGNMLELARARGRAISSMRPRRPSMAATSRCPFGSRTGSIIRSRSMRRPRSRTS